MAEDLLEKGAIMQRDKETYAIAPHIPGGIITDFNLLRRLADAAEKYGVKAAKLTSAQRIALVGLKLEDLDSIWQDLGMVPGAAIGLCVRSIKICPGTTFCRIAQQDAVGVGLPSRRKISRHAPALQVQDRGLGLPQQLFRGLHQRPGAGGLAPRAGGCWRADLARALNPAWRTSSPPTSPMPRPSPWPSGCWSGTRTKTKRSAWAGSSTTSAWIPSRRNWACRRSDLLSEPA